MPLAPPGTASGGRLRESQRPARCLLVATRARDAIAARRTRATAFEGGAASPRARRCIRAATRRARHPCGRTYARARGDHAQCASGRTKTAATSAHERAGGSSDRISSVALRSARFLTVELRGIRESARRTYWRFQSLRICIVERLNFAREFGETFRGDFWPEALENVFVVGLRYFSSRGGRHRVHTRATQHSTLTVATFAYTHLVGWSFSSSVLSQNHSLPLPYLCSLFLYSGCVLD